MQIIKRTWGELVLRERIISPISFIFGAMFVGMPAFMIVMVVRQFSDLQFNCEKVEDSLINCRVAVEPVLSFFAGTEERYQGITAVDYQIDEETDSEGEHLYDHYLLLTTASGPQTLLQGDTYFNGVRGNPEAAQRLELRLNEFLSSPSNSLAFVDESRQWNLLLIFVGFTTPFSVMGLYQIGTSFMVKTYSFDRETASLRQRRRLLGFIPFVGKTRDFSMVGEVQVQPFKGLKIGSFASAEEFAVVVPIEGKKRTRNQREWIQVGNRESDRREVEQLASELRDLLGRSSGGFGDEELENDETDA